MRRLNLWLAAAILAAGITGCRGEAQEPSTSSTARALLAQPRPEQLSTTFDAERLADAPPVLSIEELGVNSGSDEAPIKVIEFVDFGCGFCRQFQLETFPALRAEFIVTNKIQWKLMPFITGIFPNSPAATEAAECALDQGARLFGALDDRLWNEQREWKGSSDAAALVRGWALEMGADAAAYDACIQDGTRHERITSANEVARQLGIRATPTFWIVGGGPIQGALPLESFRQIFTQIYDQVTADQANGAG
jgi:protein-disulfide isomerase